MTDTEQQESTAPIISFRNVTKTFGGAVEAVKGVSFDAAPGELVVLLGESGCGKTTILKMINRLETRSAGAISIHGKDVDAYEAFELRRSIGYVFQAVGLFPHMTIAENVGVTLELAGWEKDKIDARVDALLELVRLDAGDYRARMPSELSGGQQQRVGFARALALSPSIMLLDEPFGALDPITRDALQQEFKDIQKRLNLTGVLVTHDMLEALLMADRIIVMKAGEVVQSGTPHDLMAAPASSYVSELLETPMRQMQQLDEVAR